MSFYRTAVARSVAFGVFIMVMTAMSEPAAQAQPTTAPPHPPKRLVLCLDGTWNSGFEEAATAYRPENVIAFLAAQPDLDGYLRSVDVTTPLPPDVLQRIAAIRGAGIPPTSQPAVASH